MLSNQHYFLLLLVERLCNFSRSYVFVFVPHPYLIVDVGVFMTMCHSCSTRNTDNISTQLKKKLSAGVD